MRTCGDMLSAWRRKVESRRDAELSPETKQELGRTLIIRRHAVPVLVALGLLACGAPAPAPVPPQPAPPKAPPPAPVVLTREAELEPEVALRSGALAAQVRPGVMQAPIIAHYRGGGYDVVGLSLKLKDSEAKTVETVRIDRGGLGTVDSGALFSDGEGILPEGPVLWAMVPEGRVRSVRGVLLRSVAGAAGELIHFQATGAPPSPSFRAVELWSEAMHDRFAAIPTPYHTFASQRLGRAFGRIPESAGTGIEEPVEFLVRLLEFSGSELERQALVHDHRSVWRKRTWPGVPIGKLKPPVFYPVPYAQLSQQRKLPSGGEKLAQWVPREFYYLRSKQVALLPTLLTELGQFDQSGLLNGGVALDAGLWNQYRRELGLSEDLLRSASAWCDDVALTGSDFHWRMGTDFTLLIETRDEAGLLAALEQSVSHQEPTESSWTAHLGTRIDFASNGDGLSHFRAVLDGVVVVSNSLAAMKRVIDVRSKTGSEGQNLSAAPDFNYLMARRAGPEEIVFFFGEDFIRENHSPGRVVLQLRRQLAQAELQLPLFASLLYGQLFGRLPTTRRALVGTQLVRAGELEHLNGRLIRFEPGKIPASVWGTPHRLTSLIELKPISKVRPAEVAAYSKYVENIEMGAGRLRSPGLLTLSAVGHPDSPDAYSVQFRSVPLHPGYSDYLELVHGSQLPGSLLSLATGSPGLRLKIALGEDGAWRTRLNHWLQGVLGAAAPLGHLGSWLEVGAEDRSQLAKIVTQLVDFPQFPGVNKVSRRGGRSVTKGVERAATALRDLKDAPIYIAVDVKEGAQLQDLEAWRRALEQELGAVSVEALGTFKDAQVRSWSARPVGCAADACTVQIYLGLSAGRWVVSFSKQTLLRYLESHASGVVAETWSDGPAQYFASVVGAAEGGLAKVAGWALEAHLRGRQGTALELVEALYQGDEELEKDKSYMQRARHWYGFAPITIDGEVFEWVEDGISDPRRGTRASPAWGAPQASGSPLGLWTTLLSSSWVSVAFEQEGVTEGAPLHSLAIRARLSRAGQ